jgi:hypothetical protein
MAKSGRERAQRGHSDRGCARWCHHYHDIRYYETRTSCEEEDSTQNIAQRESSVSAKMKTLARRQVSIGMLAVDDEKSSVIRERSPCGTATAFLLFFLSVFKIP